MFSLQKEIPMGEKGIGEELLNDCQLHLKK